MENILQDELSEETLAFLEDLTVESDEEVEEAYYEWSLMKGAL